MFRLALENLFARKFRLVSTSLSVMIGVAFLAGSMVLIDTIGSTFDDLFADIYEEVDVVVRSNESIDADFGEIRGTIDEDILPIVRGVEGVVAADADIQGYAQLVDVDGDPIGNPGQGAPTFGFPWTDVDELNPMVIVEGEPPRQPDEVVIDRYSADQGPFSVGDTVTVLLEGPPEEFRVSGIATFGDADTALGSSITVFTPETAQRVLGEPGRFDTVSAVGAEGIDQQELADRVATAIAAAPGGARTEVITGEALTAETQDDVASALGFFNTFMLVFAVVALFVAAFIIYNTFSIILAQRTRELALLRALGAGRGQILGSVMLEAVVIGLAASVLGIFAGLGVAALLKQLLAGFGVDIPTGSVVFEPDTVWVSLAVGIGVTVVSAVVPSRRASAIAPMEALRTSAGDGLGSLRTRLGIGAVLLGGGLSLLLWGLFGSPPDRLLVIGPGAAAVFLGVAALSPLAVAPYARAIGRPIAASRGVPGELAQENTIRNPKRTSTTAAALMIGVGLVSAITIFAASANASIAEVIDEAFVGDLVIDSGTFGFGGLSPELAAEIDELPEVEAASGVRLGFAEVDGEDAILFGIDPATMGDIVDVGVLQGSVESLDENDLAVHQEYAADQGWNIGDTVPVRFAETGVQSFEVTLIFEKDELTGDFFIGSPAYEANYRDQFDFQVYVLRAEGTTPDEARTAVETVAARYPNAEVQDLQEFKQAQADQINQLLGLVYALLALAIVIALIGIANTLALSIVERTRELGLLRAVGMTRPQLRATVRWESVMIAVFGTVLGMTVGMFFGWVMVEALRDEGFSRFVFPYQSLLVIAIIAAVAGVVAAIRPAHRAAKLDVLRAIATT
jgi:putative ABC transport system permease protein